MLQRKDNRMSENNGHFKGENKDDKDILDSGESSENVNLKTADNFELLYQKERKKNQIIIIVTGVILVIYLVSFAFLLGAKSHDDDSFKINRRPPQNSIQNRGMAGI